MHRLSEKYDGDILQWIYTNYKMQKFRCVKFVKKHALLKRSAC